MLQLGRGVNGAGLALGEGHDVAGQCGGENLGT